jgi:hypothetical protein
LNKYENFPEILFSYMGYELKEGVMVGKNNIYTP